MPNKNNKLDLLNPNVSLPLDGGGVVGGAFPLNQGAQGDVNTVIPAQAESSSPLGKGGLRGLQSCHPDNTVIARSEATKQSQREPVILSAAKDEICHSERSEESSDITDSLQNTILSSDTAFRLLKDIEQNPEVTQRHLAAKHDISLGKTNYILNALIEKGIIKAQNFKNSKNKAAYMYVLTPHGISAKTHLAQQFIKRKTEESERLKIELARLKDEITSDVSL